MFAQLPLTHVQLIRLSPNKNKAMSVFNEQTENLSNSKKDMENVVSSKKLQHLGQNFNSLQNSVEN